MTKRRRTNKRTLPNPGDVFLMPLEDGRLGVCRVLRRDTPDFVGKESVLVVATPWVGTRAPDLSEPLLREVLVLNHHAWDDQPAALWTSYPVPAEFTFLGSLTPSPAEMQLSSDAFGTWATLPIYVLDQWRWDHEREAVLSEDAGLAQAQAKQRETETQLRRKHLANVTLQELRDKRRFEDWEGVVPESALHATREIFRTTVEAILALGPQAPEAQVLDKLRACIASLNALDAQHGGFIETIEREDLCAAFEELVHASGLGHHEGLVDKWREW